MDLINPMFLPYLIFAGLIILILSSNYLLVKHYTDPMESYCFASLTNTITLSVTLISVLIIPVDIYITSQGVQKIADFQINVDVIYQLLIIIFIVIVVLLFFIMPFAYFYGEEHFDEIDTEDEIEKICNSCKYTLGFIFVCVGLITFGLIFKPNIDNQNKSQFWIQQIFDTEHWGEGTIQFVIACLLVAGMVAWSFYSAYGLAALPFKLIKGTKSFFEAKEELNTDISKIREKYREIQMKVARASGKISQKEKKQLNYLKRKEKNMTQKSEKLETLDKSQGIINKLLTILVPFRVLIGMACLVLSLLLFLSIFFSCLHRIMYSECGYKCGFITSTSSEYNILDKVLVYSSEKFPLDYLTFAIVFLYMFIASLYGVIHLGIKVFIFTIWKIKKKQTMPQALLIASVIILLIFLAVTMEILTILPQYATFGSQKTKIGDRCTLNSIENSSYCKMSNVSKFFNKISLGIPLFSTIIFCLNWTFISVYLISSLQAAFSKKKLDLGQVSLLLSQDDSDDSDEEDSLLVQT